ncbi:Protein of uncharacterised function (DUF2971) [Serratia fonticola]|uniref:DUF2971 domain-containing protein n=1 Tax=Serratia fonticola TaxID=47917 RepID=UPI0021787F53|nr:DUF2971 domain-containing protein [Serratia fonticola]CAI1923231.1 Protein of uncharacterised function (DUF2971) [Serratia fonticola]
MASLYKYMGADIADVLLMDDNHFSIKFSHLKDYNDPYEFFLTISYQRPAAELAFYNEMIGMVLQQPVTCFAKSPAIIPMWAHYANNSTGFSLEIDEDKLKQHILNAGYSDSSALVDVEYRDVPIDGINETLDRAYHICKPRYIGFLQRYIRYSAYSVKKTCWSYEQERRFIIDEDALTKINANLMVLAAPTDCIKSIIIGAKATPGLKRKLADISDKIGCQRYEMVIGKSTTEPFMIDPHQKTYRFDGENIAFQPYACQKCHEPVDAGVKQCAWCSITEIDQAEAAHRNSFRMLGEAGILDDYLESFQAIGQAARDKKG